MSCLLLLAATLAIGDSYPSCSVASKRNVPFTSWAGTDMLEVSINGNPCYEATLVLTITSEEGHRLYRYEAPFKLHVAAHWEDPDLAEDAKRLIQRFNDHVSFSKSSELPKWSSVEDYYEANYQVLQVDRAYYEMLLQQDWFVYTHKIHYEGWRVITFDRLKQQMVVVSEGGV